MDFESLFELAEEDRGVTMLENIFGSIIALVETGVAGEASGSWLNTTVQFFNLGCLLVVVVLTVYTILQLVLDTAKDGTTFGQQTDTRYTMFRVIAGGIFFIPVSGGFSVAQVVLLWLVVQGSALADSAWNRIAANELDGNTFISPARVEQGVDDQIIRQEFARAYDALVVGNICMQTLNQISAILTAAPVPPEGEEGEVEETEEVDEAEEADETVEDGEEEIATAPISLVVPDLIINNNRFSNTTTAIREVYFADTQNALRSTNSLCGGVSYEAPYGFTDEDPDSDAINTDFFRLAMSNAAQARMATYTDVILALNGEAAAVAMGIRNGSVDVNEIQASALSSVDTARINYITGVDTATSENIADTDITQLAERLQEKVSTDGWVMAAAWQRGISKAVADQRASFSDFALDVTKENNIERFLRPRDWNGGVFSRRDPTTTALLSDMEISMEAWNTVAPQIAAAARGRATNAPTSLSSGGAEEMSGALGNLAELMIDVFSPRDGEGYSDPMVDITEFGFGLIKVGGLMVGAGAAVDIASGVAAFTPARAAAPILDGLADHVLYPVGWTLLMAGFVVAAILPLIPVVYFLSAVASWLILVAESIFAVPLAVLSLFTPARESTLIGSWNKILLSIFGIFLRPLLTIIGLFAGMLLIAVVLDFSYDLFRSMVVMVAPTPSIMNIFTMLGVVIVSVIVSFYVVLLGSQLITSLGDGALNWLSIGLGQNANAMSIGQQVQARAGVEGALPNRLGFQGGGPKQIGGGGSTRPPAPKGGPTGGGSAASSLTRAALSQGNIAGARTAAATGAKGTHREGTTRGLGRDAAFKTGRNITQKGRG